MPTGADAPLDGLRVVDMADVRGELCGRILADLGADVIRIEPLEGARSRTLPPFSPAGQSLFFAYRNTNKHGVVADYRTAAGRERIESLLAGADVLIESERPGTLAANDLDPERLGDRHPSLVVASITDFGQTGPYAEFNATDDVVVALSGNLAVSGIPEKPPLLIPGALAHDTAGIHAAFAVLCALLQRRRTGRGQHLDISALEAVAQLNTWGLPNTSATINAGEEAPRVRSGASPLYPLIDTADGQVRLVILSPTQWKGMFEWLGEPEQFAEPMWADIITRFVNADVLNMAFAEHFSELHMVEAGIEAQRRGVVATPVLKPADVLSNEHYAARSTFVTAELAPGLEAPVMAGIFEIDGQRAGYRFRSPAIGEHTDEVVANPWPAQPARAGEQSTDYAPLAGLRVLDFGHGGVGVECGRLLAEYGADVIKIETRTYPDFIRIIMGGEMTPSFASSSRSKRSFGVNPRDPEGAEIIRSLAAQADIVVENNSTGTMDAMGIGYRDLHGSNPDLVMVSSQMMGSRGPYADWIGYGPTIQSVGGLNWLWNFADGDSPPGSNAIHPDHLAGRLCAIASLAAILARDRVGSGAHIEIAQVEALIATLGDLMAAEALAPDTIVPQGNDSPRGAPWGVFQCAGDQEWATICVRDDDDWLGLCAAIGDPAAATDHRFATAASRIAHRADVNSLVATWTAGRTPNEVMHSCQAHGVPAGAVLSTVEQLSDPHLEARGFCVEIDQPGAGHIVLDGPAFTGSAMSRARIEPAPALGEHTRDIASQLLGFDDDKIDQALARGVLETTPPNPQAG
ncbi:MAG: CoA transferase [Acidimicrobiia bacterium]|nr:CoA transferase [Acidimicrobiia bacterium]